jgi:hypothetical protein
LANRPNGTGFRATAGGFVRRQIAACLIVASVLASGSVFAADLTFNIVAIPGGESDPLAGAQVYGDVWAENGYAYVGTDVDGGGMNIFSFTPSGVPTFLTRYPGDQFEDVEVWDGIGYFGSDTNTTTGTGVDIVDLSIPFDPILLSRFNGSDCNAAGCGHNKVHTLSVVKSSDNNSYLYTADNATDVIKITRVFDPADLTTVNPQLVKSLDLGLPSGSPNVAAHEVIVRNDRMYVASKDNTFNTCCGWVSIYDVANPSNPVLLKQWEAGARTHTALPSADGRILVVAEERPNNVPAGNLTNVKIFDISMINSPNDPDTPVLLSTLNTSNVCHNGSCISAYSPHHPHLHGNLLFLPWYEAGLQVFNIVDPAHPVYVGAFDTYPGTSANYNGNWGVDLSQGLDTVFLSDRSRGLIAVNATGVLLQGDYNQDLKVDVADYTAWRSSFDTGSSGLHVGPFADGNYNDKVDGADYVLWRKHLGQTGPSGAGAAAGWFVSDSTVPEPASIVMFVAGLWLMAARPLRGTRV